MYILRNEQAKQLVSVYKLNVADLCKQINVTKPGDNGTVRLGTLLRATYNVEEKNVIALSYTIDGEQFKCYLNISTSPTRYQGWRFWTSCPNVNDGKMCSNRGYKLFFALETNRFYCRECYTKLIRKLENENKNKNK